jgi:hypothetical protein
MIWEVNVSSCDDTKCFCYALCSPPPHLMPAPRGRMFVSESQELQRQATATKRLATNPCFWGPHGWRLIHAGAYVSVTTKRAGNESLFLGTPRMAAHPRWRLCDHRICATIPDEATSDRRHIWRQACHWRQRVRWWQGNRGLRHHAPLCSRAAAAYTVLTRYCTQRCSVRRAFRKTSHAH